MGGWILTQWIVCSERATFVIDGQGFVRGCAEGVFNHKGHLRYAESWLARIESEKACREQSAREIQQSESLNDRVDSQLQPIAPQEALPEPVPKSHQQYAYAEQPLQPMTRPFTHKRHDPALAPASASLAYPIRTQAGPQATPVQDGSSSRILNSAATPSVTSALRNGVLSSRLELEPPPFQNVDELAWYGSDSAQPELSSHSDFSPTASSGSSSHRVHHSNASQHTFAPPTPNPAPGRQQGVSSHCLGHDPPFDNEVDSPARISVQGLPNLPELQTTASPAFPSGLVVSRPGEVQSTPPSENASKAPKPSAPSILPEVRPERPLLSNMRLRDSMRTRVPTWDADGGQNAQSSPTHSRVPTPFEFEVEEDEFCYSPSLIHTGSRYSLESDARSE